MIFESKENKVNSFFYLSVVCLSSTLPPPPQHKKKTVINCLDLIQSARLVYDNGDDPKCIAVRVCGPSEKKEEKRKKIRLSAP